MGRSVAIPGFLAAAVLLLQANFAAAEPSFKEMFTEPAVGDGIAGGLGFFHKKEGETSPDPPPAGEGRMTAPSLTAVVGFDGIGKAADGFEALQDAETVWNAGGGFRYLTAREFGLQMGVDVARGPEQWAIYVVFGNSWF